MARQGNSGTRPSRFALGLGGTSPPFFPQSVVTISIFALLTIFGFWVSLGDQKLFNDSILER